MSDTPDFVVRHRYKMKTLAGQANAKGMTEPVVVVADLADPRGRQLATEMVRERDGEAGVTMLDKIPGPYFMAYPRTAAATTFAECAEPAPLGFFWFVAMFDGSAQTGQMPYYIGDC